MTTSTHTKKKENEEGGNTTGVTAFLSISSTKAQTAFFALIVSFTSTSSRMRSSALPA